MRFLISVSQIDLDSSPLTERVSIKNTLTMSITTILLLCYFVDVIMCSQIVLKVVLFAGNRLDELHRTVAALAESARACRVALDCHFYFDHNAIRTPRQKQISTSVLHDIENGQLTLPCHTVHIATNNASVNGQFAEQRFKMHWFWAISHVFATDDETDVLFLEDDVVVAPDALTVFNLLSTAKRRPASSSQFVSLGAWGGENLVNARARLIVQHRMHNLPTIGYGFNKTVWRALVSVKDRFFKHPSPDWAIAAAGSLHDCIVVISPTLSRVWHIGSSGLHMWSIQTQPNWKNDELLRPDSCATLDLSMRNWFGFHCFNYNSTPSICRNTCHREREAEFPALARHTRVVVSEMNVPRPIRLCIPVGVIPTIQQV
jgi:hypothetical protein